MNAKGVFAFGALATGVVAAGSAATGVVAIGQLSRGVIAVGQGAIGLIAVGQISVGVLWCMGQVGTLAEYPGVRGPPGQLDPGSDAEFGEHVP